jgi:hypothetical protein
MPLIPCPSCSKRISSLSTTCRHCHAQVDNLEAAGIPSDNTVRTFCTGCGTQHIESASFCQSCGQQIASPNEGRTSPRVRRQGEVGTKEAKGVKDAKTLKLAGLGCLAYIALFVILGIVEEATRGNCNTCAGDGKVLNLCNSCWGSGILGNGTIFANECIHCGGDGYGGLSSCGTCGGDGEL